MCGYCRPAAVIKMEGGTDHDLRILDLPTEEEEEREKAAAMSAAGDASKREEHKTQEADRKPSAEKDKNEKVKFELGLCSCTVQNDLDCFFFLTVNLFTGGEQLCRRERLRSRRRGWQGGGKEREQQGRST